MKAATKPRNVTPKGKAAGKPMKTKPEEYSLEFLEQEIRRVNGKIYIAAKAIGCTSKVLYDYIKRHPELKEIVDDARSIIVDKAEIALESAITSKQGWAVCFTLKTLGKDRGYVERNEMTGKDGAPLFDSAQSAAFIAKYMQETGNTEEKAKEQWAAVAPLMSKLIM